ncbi:hypothetical protein PMAYCL1PPCAC_27898, partial [Pristionchus mayeri]
GSLEIKNENGPLDIPSEVKEEPLDVKDEPIDDFSDINHDEPIADIFCPSTGISRPLDQSSPMISSAITFNFKKSKCDLCDDPICPY